MTDTTADELAAMAARRKSGEAPGRGRGGQFAWSPKARPPKLPRLLLTILLAIFMIEVVGELMFVGAMAGVFVLLEKSGGEPTAMTDVLATFVLWAQPYTQYGRLSVLIPCILGYTIFVFCAARNLSLSNARGMDSSPAMAAGWSFVPIANLGQIYNVMKQIWIGSHDPAKGMIDRPFLLPLWWGLYLGGNALSMLGNRMVPTDAALELLPSDRMFGAFAPSLAVLTASVIATLTGCALLMKVVGQVTNAQARNAAASEAAPPAAELAPAV